jgi:hypothetical protein
LSRAVNFAVRFVLFIPCVPGDRVRRCRKQKEAGKNARRMDLYFSYVLEFK